MYSAAKTFLYTYALAVWHENRDRGVVFQTLLPGTWEKLITNEENPAKWNLSEAAAFQNRLTKPFAEKVGPVDRQRSVREPVEGVIAIDDFLPTGVAAGEFDGGFHRLSSAVAEKHPA